MSLPHAITLPQLVGVAVLAGLIWLICVVVADEAKTSAGGATTISIEELHPVPRAFVSLLAYALGPLRLWSTHRLPPPAQTVTSTSPNEFDQLPDEVRHYLTKSEVALQLEGFGSPVRAQAQTSPQVTTYFSLLEHDGHETLATVGAVRTVRGKTVCMTLFRSEVSGGPIVVTTNSPHTQRFPDRPGYEAVAFSAITDPVALFRMHRFRTSERASDKPLTKVTRAPDPIAYQTRENAEAHERWLRIGYYDRMANGVLRPTLRGAVCLVWRAKFPWAQIERRRRTRERDAILARYAQA